MWCGMLLQTCVSCPSTSCFFHFLLFLLPPLFLLQRHPTELEVREERRRGKKRKKKDRPGNWTKKGRERRLYDKERAKIFDNFFAFCATQMFKEFLSSRNGQ